MKRIKKIVLLSSSNLQDLEVRTNDYIHNGTFHDIKLSECETSTTIALIQYEE